MSRSLATPTGTRKSVMPEGNATRSPGAARVPQIVDGDEEDDIGSSDDEIVAAHTSLTESLQNIMISVRSASEVPPDHSHFFGKSSSFTLVQTAMEMKHEYTMKEAPEGPRNHVFSHRRPEFWHPYPVSFIFSLSIVVSECLRDFSISGSARASSMEMHQFHFQNRT